MFLASVFNNASNAILNLSKYVFTWSVTDSGGRSFTQFTSYMSSMLIKDSLLVPNDIYQVCVSVSNSITLEQGASCSKYNSYGISNLFAFTVNPSVGYAFNTSFTFSSINTQTLTHQYFYEFGYVLLKLDVSNIPYDSVYVPF
jgi:hypothetical protein